MQARLDSQDVLDDENRRYHFVLTEQALLIKTASDAVMAGQLRHMIAVSRLPNVTISILPARVLLGAVPLNTFVIYDERLVTVELFSGAVAMRDHRDVRYHLNLFEHFRERSIAGDEARDRLASVADEFVRARE